MKAFRIHSLDAWDWDAVPVTVDLVLEHWSTALRRRSPWDVMLADDASGYIRPVVSELLNEARHPCDGTRSARLRRHASAHGAFRRRQRLDDRALVCECDLLPGAVESALLAGGLTRRFVGDSIVVLGPDLQLVRDAALLGWAVGSPAE